MQLERYEGKRWKIIYGNYSGVEKTAINNLQRYLQKVSPYVLEVSNTLDLNDDKHIVLIGTKESNSLINDLVNQNIIEILDKNEFYTIKVMSSPYFNDAKLIVIAGSDANGVLYGVEEFYKSVMLKYIKNETFRFYSKDLETVEDIEISDSPVISRRGIWTWGYVIYNYKKYFDNMVRCKLNTVTIWNDELPINIKEVISYAKDCGIDVYLGFAWGWDTFVIDPADKKKKEEIKNYVINLYKNEYVNLDIEGIYFQLGFTECRNLDINGKSIAEYSKEWVDDISSSLFDINPNLKIQFGLHGSSIKDKYPFLVGLDSRVDIVWEDCGGLPFSYKVEVASPFEEVKPDPDVSFNDTLNLCKDISKTISNSESFSIVAKGFCHLNWITEFEHHKSFILGERDDNFIKERLSLRRFFINSNNAMWMENYPYAIKYYSEMSKSVKDILAIGLIEDGCFEIEIPQGFAMFSEMLWNPDEKIISKAFSGHYS